LQLAEGGGTTMAITGALAQELIELEKKYWQAIKDGDAETASELSDDPCIIAGAQGVFAIDKSDLRSMMEKASYKLESFEVDDEIEVKLLTDDVAVLAYKVHEELVVDGNPVSVDAADSSTWIRRDGKWVCAAHTESIKGDPFGRDRRASGAM
jgi:uncharacterized protein (TIGR02246 family)